MNFLFGRKCKIREFLEAFCAVPMPGWEVSSNYLEGCEGANVPIKVQENSLDMQKLQMCGRNDFPSNTRIATTIRVKVEKIYQKLRTYQRSSK